MKAIRVHAFGGPEVLQLEDVPNLAPLQPGEVLVRVMAAGVNPYDTYMRAGAYGAANPVLPYTPGSDAAGIVESVGSEVDLAPGQRVYTSGSISGAYAEYVVCKRSQVHLLPERISFAQGAGIFVPYFTAYRALFQLAVAKPGESVLIHGASGGVGLAALQFARASGIRTIGTAGSAEGLRLIRSQGVDHAVDHSSADYQKEILDLTSGSGVDVIVEMLANANLANDLKMLDQRGRVVIVGSRGTVEINPREIMLREAAVFGVFLWRVPEADAAEIATAVHSGLESGALNPVIALELPLGSAPEAHRRIMEPGARGKIVLIP